jgi:D-serine deaminase-like pyridoxal phosphate-dependent protein
MPLAQDEEALLLDNALTLHRERTFDVNDLDGLATPFLLIDEVILTRNIERMADYCREHNLALRPHTKTHKSLEIARRQLAAGAVGLTVAKPGEARVMDETGASLLIAYPPIIPACLTAIEELRWRGDIIVALDSFVAVERLESILSRNGPGVGALVDIDIGLGRTGVSNPEASTQIAERIVACAELRLDGLFCYPGHITELPDEQGEPIARATEVLRRHLDAWVANGLQATIVSGGSTPSAYNSHLMTGITEVRPGSYVFNDANTLRGRHCLLADCAARIVTTVVSDAVPGQVIVDAGSKALARDQCFPQPVTGYGFVLEYPEARVKSLSEEHGQIDISQCSRKPRIGERVSIIPNHICPAVNLTDVMWLRTTGGSLKELRVDARGMVR